MFDNQMSLDYKETSIIRVLTHGSGVKPITIQEVQDHFQKTDKTGWQIICNELLSKSKEELKRIWEGVEAVQGVQFTTNDLVKLLLTLPGADMIESKLTID